MNLCEFLEYCAIRSNRETNHISSFANNPLQRRSHSPHRAECWETNDSLRLFYHLLAIPLQSSGRRVVSGKRVSLRALPLNGVSAGK